MAQREAMTSRVALVFFIGCCLFESIESGVGKEPVHDCSAVGGIRSAAVAGEVLGVGRGKGVGSTNGMGSVDVADNVGVCGSEPVALMQRLGVPIRVGKVESLRVASGTSAVPVVKYGERVWRLGPSVSGHKG